MQGDVGARVLADFARLPASTDATGWRKDANAKYHGVKSILFVTANDWCDDPRELDARIDVLTRLCNPRSASPNPSDEQKPQANP